MILGESPFLSESTWDYSQIIGEEGMISATIYIRGGIRKEYLYTKLKSGAVLRGGTNCEWGK